MHWKTLLVSRAEFALAVKFNVEMNSSPSTWSQAVFSIANLLFIMSDEQYMVVYLDQLPHIVNSIGNTYNNITLTVPGVCCVHNTLDD